MRLYLSICLKAFAVLVISSCSYNNYPNRSFEKPRTQNSFLGMPSEPGKCYAKCIIQNQYETTSTTPFPVYLGTYDESKNYLDKVVKVITPASTKWEKRKADRNCLSSDPNDCLVWCLVEVPEESKEYTIVTDTLATKNFEWVSHSKKKLVKPGGHTEWKQVVCDSDFTSDFHQRLRQALFENGCDIDISDLQAKYSSNTKEILLSYQRNNGLPVGQLDIETLASLGINI